MSVTVAVQREHACTKLYTGAGSIDFCAELLRIRRSQAFHGGIAHWALVRLGVFYIDSACLQVISRERSHGVG